VALGGMIHHNFDNPSPMADLSQLLADEDSPLYTVNYPLAVATYRAARDQNVRVLLDGIDGDSIIGHGWGYLTELAYCGEWHQLQVEIEALTQSFGGEAKWYLNRFILPELSTWLRDGKLRHVIRAINAIHAGYHLSRKRLVTHWLATPLLSKSSSRGNQRGISPAFLKSINIKKYHTTTCHKPIPETTARAIQYNELRRNSLQTVLEEQDRASSAARIELRHPLCDKRIAEFCLALPPEQRLRSGWTRRILREAMAGFLPDVVRWRTDKTNFSAHLVAGLLNQDRPIVEKVLEGHFASKYLDYTQLHQLYQELPKQHSPQNVAILLRTVRLALWLQAGRG
jgi:asparagine synthase (glutamine-hydrolysing)